MTEGHRLAHEQIRKHGKDRYPSAVFQALKANAELGELSDAILKGNLDEVRKEYADAGLALFELGNKLGLDLIECMQELVHADERKFA